MKYRIGLLLGMALVLAIGSYAFGSEAGTKDDTQKGFELFMSARHQLDAGDVQGAIQTAAGISHNSLKAVAFSHIAVSQVKTGDRIGVARSVTQILRAAAYAGSDSEKSNILVCALVPVGGAQAKVGDHVGAAKTFEEALEVTRYMLNSNKGKDEVLRSIVGEQARASDIQGAMQSAAGIQNEKPREYALKDIARAQAKSSVSAKSN